MFSHIKHLRRFCALVNRTITSTTSPGVPLDCDVAIVGGGLVGLSLATSLAGSKFTSGLKTVVIDTQPPQLKESVLRVYAMSPNTIDFFQALNLWDGEVAQDASHYDSMKVWDASSPGVVEFTSEDAALPYLGAVISEPSMESSFLKRLNEYEHVKVISRDGLKSLTMKEGGTTIETTAGHVVNAQLVVGSDGAQSRLRSLAKFGRVVQEYGEMAVVASLTSNELTQTAWQRFLPTGPIALLPYGGGYSLVWSNPGMYATELMKLTEAEFIIRLNEALQAPASASLPPLPFAQPVESIPTPPLITGLKGLRGMFPLSVSSSRPYVKPRIALIGDAAHTIHPMAGQGLNLGFADVVTLTRALQNAIQTGRGLGDLTVLREYDQEASRRNGVMQAGVHTMHQLFSLSNPLLQFARGVGMLATNNMPIVKKLFVNQAVGADVSLRGIGSNLF